MTNKNDQEEILGFEFEGPMGHFWIMPEVPTSSLAAAIEECLDELAERGYSEAEIVEMITAVRRKRQCLS
jgi:hypothetical protein